MTALKIAYLTSDFPYPPLSGGQLRDYELLRRFARTCEVELFCPPPSPSAGSGDVEAVARHARLHLTPPGPKSFGRKLWDYFVEPFHFKGFSAPLLEAIRTRHRQTRFDILHCESLHGALYALRLKGEEAMTCALTHHNAESQLFARLRREERPGRRLLSRLPLARLRSIERRVLRELDVCFSYSPLNHVELSRWSPPGRLHRTTCGCDTENISASPAGRRNHLVFVGALDYFPNHHGILWFLDKVWKFLPEFTLTIAGRSPLPELHARARDSGGRVKLVAGPRDILPYIREAQVEIVPLPIGGGMCGKILEAFAAGKPVVTTTVGAQGIEVEPGRNILIADLPEDFAEAIRRLAGDPELAGRVGREARKTAERLYSWDKIAGDILEVYQGLKPRTGTGGTWGP